MPFQDAIHLIVNSYSTFTQQERTQHISPSALVAYPVAALSRQLGNSSGKSKRRKINSKTNHTSNSHSSRHANSRDSDSSDSERKNELDECLPPTCKRPAKLSEVKSIFNNHSTELKGFANAAIFSTFSKLAQTVAMYCCYAFIMFAQIRSFVNVPNPGPQSDFNSFALWK